MAEPTVVDIKRFLDHGSTVPVKMAEMQEFWKSLSEPEKQEYRNSISRWDGKSEFIN